mmetsp:Transcript_12166/g.32650  ORF Transcript_12166/g.32650 Transcript_12166/m.32650 type:complete len:184 (-) Transcript_12166:91-642(-)
MFRTFSKEKSVSGLSQVKSSVQRGIRQSILDQYPGLEDEIEELLPKKAPLLVAKCANHISLIASGATHVPLFFQTRDGPFVPTLHLLHQFPDMLPRFQVDRGAIRFVLSGANIMAPGLTSPGGNMADVPADTVVGIFAEGKEHALAIGVTLASTQEIRATNKGVSVENTHYLNDGLWLTESVE